MDLLKELFEWPAWPTDFSLLDYFETEKRVMQQLLKSCSNECISSSFSDFVEIVQS